MEEHRLPMRWRNLNRLLSQGSDKLIQFGKDTAFFGALWSRRGIAVICLVFIHKEIGNRLFGGLSRKLAQQFVIILRRFAPHLPGAGINPQQRGPL
jgi:hypothetical protein